jgi:gliding motility-associated-like protein
MIRSTLSKKAITGFSAAILLGLSHMASGQIMFNNGAQIWTGPQSIIQVNGGIENSTAGSVDHNGTMTVTKNSTFLFPGNVILSGASTWQGDGVINVEQDWVNNATFIADNSNVELYGNTRQYITGTVATTFDTLILSGTGTGLNRMKSQTIDATIDATGALKLNDRELDTDVNTMFVLNPDVNAITNNTILVGGEGFVSSLAPGVLSRVTNTTSTYIFPTGSSLGVTRYRPVLITPNSASVATPATYTSRFVNHNSDNDGFLRSINDNSLCTAIDTFYHAILRTAGTSFADVGVAYLPSADGTWDGMAHWRTTNNMWNDMIAPVTASLGSYTTNTKMAWQFANPGDPYVLTELRPAAPTLVCPPPICANTPGNLFSATGGSSYTWSVPSGATIASGQGSDSLLVNWGSTGGTVYVVTNSISGTCSSVPDSCTVTVAPSPLAAFDTLSSGPFNNAYSFIDLSTNGSTWYWDFGDGTTSASQNPGHSYEGSGTYNVMQIVTSPAGCTDTILSTVIVNEGILIPNVFSPDGDGVNDQFYIANSGLKEYSIEIFNRWGVKVFETTADEIRWDGKSTSGIEMSNGTYYFILKAVSTTGKDYSTTGFITLLTRD